MSLRPSSIETYDAPVCLPNGSVTWRVSDVDRCVPIAADGCEAFAVFKARGRDQELGLVPSFCCHDE